ncbi:DUF4920 domain-containing protein [Flavobacterium sp. ASW18X]|uniref:DUF4920 domain-containing protein n=1 Tax=Flavobacterium sp. ASW18X TaxID=2572595 RepID=UPI0010AE8398|nr:DUF4920 domain-containing protein [Flavobacterium sp. ASW18X]TKD61374.1 DUF4920 domain-containing protein [Flavobacterium sp. ASW18X]
MRVFNIFAAVFLMIFTLNSCAQKSPEGEYFGAQFEPESKQSEEITTTYAAIKVKDTVATQVSGTIKEVCQAKGCWMQVALTDGQEVFVKFKDYGFFVPKDVAGKQVFLDGLAFVEEMPVDEQKHYAEDKGATPEELSKITEPKRTLRFEASGVLIAE